MYYVHVNHILCSSSYLVYLLTLRTLVILTILSSILELHTRAYQMWGTAFLVEVAQPLPVTLSQETMSRYLCTLIVSTSSGIQTQDL